MIIIDPPVLHYRVSPFCALITTHTQYWGFFATLTGGKTACSAIFFLDKEEDANIYSGVF